VPAEKIKVENDTFQFRAPDLKPAEVIELFRRYYGPTMNAFDAAERDGKAEELNQQLVTMAEAQNTSENQGTSIPATFLRVTIQL
jgi:hypothetical protein